MRLTLFRVSRVYHKFWDTFAIHMRRRPIPKTGAGAIDTDTDTDAETGAGAIDTDTETGAGAIDTDTETGARKRERHRRPPPKPMQILRHCAERADGAKRWITKAPREPTAQNAGSLRIMKRRRRKQAHAKK